MLTEALDLLQPHEIPIEAFFGAPLPDGRSGNEASSNSVAGKLAAMLTDLPSAGVPFRWPDAQPDDVAHDSYFFIRRVTNDEAAVFARMVISARLIFLREVDEAPVSISRRTLSVIDAAFADLQSCLTVCGVTQTNVVSVWETTGVIPRPMLRWVHGHQIFAAFTQGLILSFEAMGRALRAGNRQEVRRWADLSVSLLNGSRAAFEFTGDFPPEEYLATVRPSMAPPATELSLSGLMSVDHRFLARVMRDMRPALKSLCEQDRERHAAISAALSAVYDSHIHVCERFVGAKPSILTEGRTARSGPSLIEQFKTLRMKPFEQSVVAGCPIKK